MKKRTAVYKSCRIHYNSDYSGDIIITNRDTTSVLVNKKATIFCRPLDIMSELFGAWLRKDTTIIIKSIKRCCDKEIEVLYSDIKSFVVKGK